MAAHASRSASAWALGAPPAGEEAEEAEEEAEEGSAAATTQRSGRGRTRTEAAAAARARRRGPPLASTGVDGPATTAARAERRLPLCGGASGSNLDDDAAAFMAPGTD